MSQCARQAHLGWPDALGGSRPGQRTLQSQGGRGGGQFGPSPRAFVQPHVPSTGALRRLQGHVALPRVRVGAFQVDLPFASGAQLGLKGGGRGEALHIHLPRGRRTLRHQRPSAQGRVLPAHRIALDVDTQVIRGACQIPSDVCRGLFVHPGPARAVMCHPAGPPQDGPDGLCSRGDAGPP